MDGSSAPEKVTIVGTKYYTGAFDYIISASKIAAPEEQCLYLVLDPKTDEVMLHNGNIALGSVERHNAKAVKKTISELSARENQDQVLVCKVFPINYELGFKRGTSFFVVPVYSVYERLARKFSAKYRVS